MAIGFPRGLIFFFVSSFAPETAGWGEFQIRTAATNTATANPATIPLRTRERDIG
jgi:hypothetical protein